MIETTLNNRAIKAILFDLDGTLLDSFHLHYGAYEVMFGHFGIAMSRELFLQTYSPNWYLTYEAFGLDKQHWELANSLWLEAADQHLPELFPGVAEMLVDLAGAYRLGIVTSGSRSRVTKELVRLGITQHFETVITGDDVEKPKPAPEGLVMALSELSVSPDDAIYVGDALADFEMARSVGVKFLGVPSEFANLEAAHPDYEVHPLERLTERVRAC